MFEEQYEAIINRPNEETENDEFSRVTKKIPNEKSPDDVIYNLQHTADAAEVSISSISSLSRGEEEEESSLRANHYALEIVGKNLDHVNEYLDSIMDSERLITIDTLDVQQSEESVSLSITITTYYKES
nr:type 4a pilus biogenesis protein PilO [Ornithinibacillus caprae]